MSKILLVPLSVMLALALAACGGDTPPTDTTPPPAETAPADPAPPPA